MSEDKSAEKPKKPAAKKTSNAKKVMDVQKPGKTAPSASSRPVIVGHRPTVQDPMVNEDKTMAPEEPTEEHKIEVKRTGQKVIAPLNTPDDLSKTEEVEVPSETAVPDESLVAKDETSSALPAEETPTEVPATEVEADDSEPEQVEKSADAESTVEENSQSDETPSESNSETKDSKGKGSSIVDAVVGQAAKNKDNKDDKKNEELQKRLAAVEKLVDEKKYFVETTGTTKKERKTRWVVLLLSIILLAGAYLAFDAQLIPNNYKLPYEFFKEDNQKEATISPVSNTSKNENANSESVEYKIPEGYTIYENKELGFKLAYPEAWKQEMSFARAVSGDTIENFVYNNRGYDSPTYYDKIQKKWFTLDNGKKNYIEVGNDLIKKYDVNNNSYFVFAGKGAMNCGQRHLLFENANQNKIIFIMLPEACDASADSEAMPATNTTPYQFKQLEKDLEEVLKTIVLL